MALEDILDPRVVVAMANPPSPPPTSFEASPARPVRASDNPLLVAMITTMVMNWQVVGHWCGFRVEVFLKLYASLADPQTSYETWRRLDRPFVLNTILKLVDIGLLTYDADLGVVYPASPLISFLVQHHSKR